MNQGGDDAFEVAKKMNIFTEITAPKCLSTEVLLERLQRNQEQFQEVYSKKKKKQDQYLEQSLQWRKNLHEL